MTSVLYRGSVKDLLGPVKVGDTEALVFEYSDAYSVFDWGRMPDALSRKGEALATLAADWFERLEDASSWREFSRSAEAQALRKASRFGSAFIELGEELQAQGLRTHYLGVAADTSAARVSRLAEAGAAARCLAVRRVSAERPPLAQILGRAVPDYGPTRASTPPRLVPLEVVFRFSCPEGSSLFERASDPRYLPSIGFAGVELRAGARWEFPVLEAFTKLESTDRPLPLVEALAISGLPGPRLQEVFFRTAWVAGWLRWRCARAGLELADGKLEWGVDEKGAIFLVDAIGPDELRLLKDGVQLSKEFLRRHYRGTPWFEAIGQAKSRAKAEGIAEWKKLVAEGPPALPESERELASQLYLSLANELTGRRWFEGAWDLARVAHELGARERSK
jgi:phosphoribosylaminoimidazole-succinocarboxamide synthase